MRKVLSLVLISLLIVSQISSLPESSVQAAAENLPSITNQLSLPVTITAEPLSDLEYYLTLPSGEQEYFFATNSGTGERVQEIKLGKRSDDTRAECVITEDGRKKGICEDGIYQLEVVATDAAGNRSPGSRHSLERDTVRPAISTLGELTLCGNDICVEIAGEQAAGIYANGKYLHTLDASGPIQLHVLQNWQYDTRYRYEFSIRDTAGNISDTHVRELHTDVLAVGDADPFQGKDTTTLKPVAMDVNIEYGGDYKITNYMVPFPILTFAETSIQNLVSIYGVALAKGHALEVRVTTRFMTFDRARAACSAPDSIPFMNAKERECMQRHMGISSIWDWHWQVLKDCGYVIPGYTALCIENKKSTKFVSQYKDKVQEKVDHVLIVLYNQNGQEVGRLWNDDATGRFRLDRALGEGLNVGDSISAKVVIFGDFEYDGVKVDYRGVDAKSAARNEGLSSAMGNEVVVPEPKKLFLKPVGFPFRDWRLFGNGYPKYFGTAKANEICSKVGCASINSRGVMKISRGGSESGHGPDAIDFATSSSNYSLKIPTIVVATHDGTVKIQNKTNYNTRPVQWVNGRSVCPADARPIMLSVTSHDKKYKTLYLHFDPKATTMKVWNGKKEVKRGDPVGLVGNTGCTGGPHLHYAIVGFSPSGVYNSLSDSYGLDILPENLNVEDEKAIQEYINLYLDNNNYETPEIKF